MKKIIKIILIVLLVFIVGCQPIPPGKNIIVEGNKLANNSQLAVLLGANCCHQIIKNNISNNGNFTDNLSLFIAINESGNDTALARFRYTGGVIFNTEYGNNLVANNTINNNIGFSVFEFPPIIFKSSRNIFIIDNNITNTKLAGLLLFLQNESYIYGNNLINNTLAGIVAGGGNNSIISNNISGTNLNINRTFFNNVFMPIIVPLFGGENITSYSFGDGITTFNVENLIIENNTINSNQGFGIAIMGSENVSISGNNITVNNLSGIDVFASNAAILNNNISNNGVNGTEFFLNVSNTPIKIPPTLSIYNGITSLGITGSLVNISNSTINNNLDNGILNINQTSNIMNNTICYNGIAAITDLSSNSTQLSNEFCNASVIFKKMWWADFLARDEEGKPLNGTNITARDVYGTEWVNNLTDITGHFLTALLEYFTNDSSLIYYSNYSVNASKLGYTNVFKSFNLTNNIVVNLTLELIGGAIWDLDPPTLPLVVDGYNYVDYDWTNSNSSLNASWFNSTDRNTIWYVYRIYENGTCILPEDCSFAVDVGQSTQTTVMLNLTECSNYTFQVQARDTFWNRANWSSSDGIVVDLTPPSISTLTSSSHPDENASYINRSIVLEWSAADSGTCPSGIESYSYLLDENNETIPDNVPETNATTITFYDVEPATWYFHIKAKDFAGSWSNTLHYRINIVPSEVRIRLNPVESPTFFGSVNITGNVNKNVSLISLFVNSNNTQNLTDVFAGEFNFTDVSLKVGMNVIYADAYINDTFVGTSNTLYIKKINETKFNVSELDIVRAGACPGSFCGAATDTPLDGVFGGATIKAGIEGTTMIVITKEDAPTTERIALLQNKSFFEFINPSFGYPLDLKTVEIGALINYPNIVLIGNKTVPAGRYAMTIRNEGIDNETGRPKINVTIS